MSPSETADLNTLIEEAQQIPPIPAQAAVEYELQKEQLIEQVNQTMQAQPDLFSLIGFNPLTVLFDNHRNHAQFMLNVFKLNQFDLLARTIPWVYRTYHAHGFSFNYFPRALQAWMAAVEAHLSPPAASSINSVYQWMIRRHAAMIKLAEDSERFTWPVDPGWSEVQKTFLAALLQGDHRQCLRLAAEHVSGPDDLPDFYLQVIQPAMYEVGRLWEFGEISVAQEHLSSAIVARVMAALSPRFTPKGTPKGKAVVTSAPNEFHSLGGWMVSDLLEMDGWEVRYLGPNTPKEELVKLIKQIQPHLLSISIVMPFNLDRTQETIETIRRDPELQSTRIMVGGLVFQNAPELWKRLGADGYAPNAREAVALARQWWNPRS